MISGVDLTLRVVSHSIPPQPWRPATLRTRECEHSDGNSMDNSEPRRPPLSTANALQGRLSWLKGRRGDWWQNTDFSPVVGVGLCQASAKFSYTLRWRDGESLEQQSSIWGQEFEYLQARHLQITPSPPKSADSSIEPVKLSNLNPHSTRRGRPEFFRHANLRPSALSGLWRATGPDRRRRKLWPADRRFGGIPRGLDGRAGVPLRGYVALAGYAVGFRGAQP